MTGCKFDKYEADESIHCITCNLWYHSQCIDVYPNKITLSCPECKVMSQTLKKLVKEVDNVCHVYGKELSIIKSKLVDKECEKLKVENISLRKQVASLNEAVKPPKWVDFKHNAPTTTSSKTLLIGGLSISNIDENKLYNSHVECY